VAPEGGFVADAPSRPARSARLDVLRAIAILLVLGRHGYVTKLWFRIGWTGVDLFFVLSGFLVTGLLLSEQRRRGQMDPVRFWLRRAFKIYPPFYVLLFFSAITRFHQSGHVLADALFLQNFVPGWWHHTWSLAIEEHFYFLMPVGLVLLARAANNDRSDPFKRLPLAVAVVALAALALRLVSVAFSPPPGSPDFLLRHAYPTPMRIDGLAFGALISYLYHYRQQMFARLGRPALAGLAAVSLLPLIPCALVDIEESRALVVVGLTALYLGFGALLIVVLQWPAPTAPSPLRTLLARALGYVGRHSYSIYLWHLPVRLVTERVFARALPQARDQTLFAAYAAASMAIGIVFAKLIEVPTLRLRDHLLPSEARAVEPPAPPVPGV
jgi:peptidoglycan/LPS O-acetylase OafA/YrhL